MKQGKHNLEWPAQPDNLAVQQGIDMLESSADALLKVAGAMRNPKPKPQVRTAMRRALSGVLADVETVRVSIRE